MAEQDVKTCIPVPAIQRRYPDFMEKVAQIKIRHVSNPKPKLAMSTTENDKVEVKSELPVTTMSVSVLAGQLTTQWAALSPQEKTTRVQDCHDKWDIFFFVHNIPFHLINSQYFRDAVKADQRCPTYKPCGRETLAGSHLDKQSALADDFNASRMRAYMKFGFVLTGDGYRSKGKKQYHNYILITVAGPIFLGIKDVTGEGSCAQDVFQEFVVVQNELPDIVRQSIMLGITDTPSVNVKAWKLLMKKFPHQVWMGCMPHEISSFFGDVAKLPASARLRGLVHYLVKWVMNHSDILQLFRTKVKAHFQEAFKKAKSQGDKGARAAAKSRQTMVLYKPGDTRMLTMFRMLARCLFLVGPLVAMFNDASYPAIAQKCIKNYNAQCKEQSKKIKKRAAGGAFIDITYDYFGSANSPIYKDIDEWLSTMLGAVYFHLTVDTHKPSLFMVYYMSALIDKQLRVLDDLGKAQGYIKDVHGKFMKRWERYHRPCHTLAYHMAPQFQTHDISDDEKKDIMVACKQLYGSQHLAVYNGLLNFKKVGMATKVDKGIWEDADRKLPHEWYDAYGFMLDL